MRCIIKAVDRPAGAPEHLISALIYCICCDFERISSYYISCLPELLTIFRHLNITISNNHVLNIPDSKQLKL